ncbi:MAG: CHASE3 domain-containing protein [Verrucomicrobia bacterium]|nr:CHASE3 domain-containing protein [Verrucomicrobiota bacterium]MDE3099646.1 CHASE3 domain-containing protein [Verrucomicrobiota bacterium]
MTLPSLALLAMVWIVHRTYVEYNDAVAAATRAEKVFILLDKARTRVTAAGMGERGYLLTGRGQYRRLHDTALAAADNDLEELKPLFEGDPTQEKTLNQLETEMKNRLETGGTDSGQDARPDASAGTLTDHNGKSGPEFQRLFDLMQQHEADLVAQRDKRIEGRLLFDQEVAIGLVIVTAIGLLTVIGVAAGFARLRRVVTICAWTGQVQDGEDWVRLEDYLKKRFGVSVTHGVSKEAADKMMQGSRPARVTMDKQIPPDPPKP